MKIGFKKRILLTIISLIILAEFIIPKWSYAETASDIESIPEYDPGSSVSQDDLTNIMQSILDSTEEEENTEEEGGALFTPISQFILGIADGVMSTLQSTFIGDEKFSNIITNLQDIIFWILSGLILIYSIFEFTDGELRLYIFLGILLGFIAYLLIFSKIYIKVCVDIILVIKKILYYTLILPIEFILKTFKKLIFNPIMIFFRKMSNPINKSIKKVKKCIVSNKNSQEKKDFA